MLNAAELEFCSEHHITARTEFRAGWMKRDCQEDTPHMKMLEALQKFRRLQGRMIMVFKHFKNCLGRTICVDL